MYEKLGKATCPDSFTIAPEGVPSIVELLPIALADIEHDLARHSSSTDSLGRPKSAFTREEDAEDIADLEARRQALQGLAARLGVELDQRVA